MKVLVTGGVRSGKSRHAEELLASYGEVTYVAPGPTAAEDPDPDWVARIEAHRSRRPAGWTTLESRDLASRSPSPAPCWSTAWAPGSPPYSTRPRPGTSPPPPSKHGRLGPRRRDVGSGVPPRPRRARHQRGRPRRRTRPPLRPPLPRPARHRQPAPGPGVRRGPPGRGRSRAGALGLAHVRGGSESPGDSDQPHRQGVGFDKLNRAAVAAASPLRPASAARRSPRRAGRRRRRLAGPGRWRGRCRRVPGRGRCRARRGARCGRRSGWRRRDGCRGHRRRRPRPGPRSVTGGRRRPGPRWRTPMRGSAPSRAASTAVSREPGRLRRSSRRAEAQPKSRYRSLRWPTIASRVLAARYASSPGTPASAPRTSGATTASDVFSATDSITARAISPSSRSAVSRPTRWVSRWRASGRRSSASSRATARASRSSEEPPEHGPRRDGGDDDAQDGATRGPLREHAGDAAAAPTRTAAYGRPRPRVGE